MRRNCAVCENRIGFVDELCYDNISEKLCMDGECMAITQWELSRATVGGNQIRILLCDDDPVFLNLLQGTLERILEKLNLHADIHSCIGPAMLSRGRLESCDMAFFDIDFDSEDCNGIDIARSLREVNSRALVFFVTNYIEYAPEGFEVQAFRYILKRDLDQVLERYILQAVDAMAESQVCLRLREQDHVTDLPLERIRYLEVLDHYVSIHADSGTYTLGTTLTAMESQLERHGFLRIHKSYLVNMDAIRKFRSRECLLSDGTSLAVGEKNYAKQKQKYMLWKGLK